MKQTDSMHTSVKKYEKAELGFWLYLLTDIILFASLFATYMILRPNTNGGPTSADILEPSYALLLTVILLISSFTAGIATLALRYKRLRLAVSSLLATILLGAAFLVLELAEFSTLVRDGHAWTESAFLSAFFVLVGTHGLHILVGFIWGSVLVGYVVRQQSTADSVRKMTLFSLFWHFLDLVWIFLFTIVYLGATV